jgi:transposase
MVNVGIDLHKTQFTVCVRQQGRKDWSGQFETTEDGYKQFFARAKRWKDAGHKVRVGVESTGNTRYFKNRMEDAGIKVVVINTLKFKIVNESTKKTDKHDAATIAEFLEKDMLPESHLCSRESEGLRRVLKIRQTLVSAEVKVKNQVHALMVSEGLEDTKASLQSKKGRQQVQATLEKWDFGLAAQPLMNTIDSLSEHVKELEKQLWKRVEKDRTVELLKTIPGCGNVCSTTIRAYVDDIKRFPSGKKFASYCGLVPWVQNSNETVHHGKITKRGPEALRTAIVQIVLGMRRCKKTTASWRMMEQYEAMKKTKSSGKAIIAAARKVAMIIWQMLTDDAEFDAGLMTDKKLEKKAKAMRAKAANNNDSDNDYQEQEKSKGKEDTNNRRKPVKGSAVPKKAAQPRQGKDITARLAVKALKNPGAARGKIKKVG